MPEQVAMGMNIYSHEATIIKGHAMHVTTLGVAVKTQKSHVWYIYMVPKERSNYFPCVSATVLTPTLYTATRSVSLEHDKFSLG